MGNFVKAAKKSAISAGSGCTVEVSGKSIALFQVEGKYYAMDNVCAHRGGSLGEGSLDGNVVTCPWHGFQFDVTTGYCATQPGLQQTKYNVKIKGDDILIEV